MLWLGFTLMNLQQLRMLARVTIISAYDPSRESMVAYASPSNRIAIVITVLVTQSIAQGRFQNSYHHFSTLDIFTLLHLYLNSPQFKFTCSLLSCKGIQQHLQSTSSFVLVLGKANVKRAQSRICGRQDLREYLFYLQLLVGFDTLTYRKLLRSPILVGYQDLFWRRCWGSIAWGEYSRVCLFALSLSNFYLLF